MFSQLSADDKNRLQDILHTMRGFPHWPCEYHEFFRIWGHFNAVYKIVTPSAGDKIQVCSFALQDYSKGQNIWNVISGQDSVKELAQQPCVGDNRENSYLPSAEIQVAFHTLRDELSIPNINNICQNSKCQIRTNAPTFTTCAVKTNWPNKPGNIVVTDSSHAKFIPLGATLLILYQIRNNLFHGAKYHATDTERNRHLTRLGADILQHILAETEKLI